MAKSEIVTDFLCNIYIYIYIYFFCVCSVFWWDKPKQANFCLRVAMWFFLGISRFRSTLLLPRLKRNEIILTGRKTQIKKKRECFLLLNHLGVPSQCCDSFVDDWKRAQRSVTLALQKMSTSKDVYGGLPMFCERWQSVWKMAWQRNMM